MMEIMVRSPIDKGHDSERRKREFIEAMPFGTHIQLIADPEDVGESMHLEETKADGCRELHKERLTILTKICSMG